jgi:4-O-beta-D-mannosyl-D-glucose phosphorylase
MYKSFSKRLKQLRDEHDVLVRLPNHKKAHTNGVIDRYANPILTAAHIPLEWRFDLDAKDNPYLMERIGFNAVLNAGAIKWKDKYLVIVRVEGADRKSFFAIAESHNGVDHFKFWARPIVMPETDTPDTNVYDMRVVQHEDGWVYGLFCTERKDPNAPPGDQSMAIAQCGIARTKDLVQWERLPDLKTPSAQQRNVVLHPEFVHGKYLFYTRPQDSFIEAGKGGGIGWGLSESMNPAVVDVENILDAKMYHTVYEMKNGLGPAPIKTIYGWLHLAHGVRNTAAGLRYVLYMFMTDKNDPTQVIYKPAGYFMAPEGEERIGDVSNVLFSNGWIAEEEGRVLIYYASSDTRMHVAQTSIDRLCNYVMNTPPDGFRSAASVQTVLALIQKNEQIADRILNQEEAQFA